MMKRGVQILCVTAVILLAAARVQVQSSAKSDADARADAILAKMSLEQKIDLLGGTDGFFIRAMPEFGVPALRMADGPIGVRNFGPATAMAAGINLAATWDPALAERVGTQIGRDARAKGVNFLLGPGLNIYRAPLNGRNFEYFGEDPYLASRIAVGYIDGVQSQGVSATAKHFVANNSEFDRHNTDSIIDERTLREIYLPVFESAVKDAHVGAVMDSYNLVNGIHTTQNEILDTEILKKEWGFQGVLMSDWLATYDGVAAANSGLDLEMPSGAFMNRATLLPAVRDGKVSLATIDDKVRRILRLAVKSHWLDRDQTDLAIPRYNLEGRRAALAAAEEGMVLLKNDGNVLPLNRHAIKSVAVIGPDADPAVPVGGGSAGVRPFAAVSFLEGIANELGPSVRTYYRRGIPELSELAQNTNFSTTESGSSRGLAGEYFLSESLEGEPMLRRTDAHVNFGADSGFGAAAYPAGAVAARWTGYYTASNAGDYDFFVQSTGEAGGYYRLYVDGKLNLDNWTIAKALVGYSTLALSQGPHKIVLERHGRPGFLGTRFRFGIVRRDSYVDPAAEKIAASADAVVVAVGFDPESESEGSDRTFGLPPGQDQLIEKMAAANKRVIVIITSGGAVDMNAWVDRIPALLEAWYPGQEGGTALAQIIFGDVNPSGRLPVSFERRWEDNPVHDSYYPEAGSTRVVYNEGIFVGYRGYEHENVKTRFEFGSGLSYSTFQYRSLSVRPIPGISDPTDRNPARGSTPLYQVSFDVTNTGTRAGATVAEVYVGESHPRIPRPLKELKGFARISLCPGETRHVTIPLNGRAFSFYDVSAHGWRVNPGEFTVYVGQSVEQLELKNALIITPPMAASAGSAP